MSLWTQTRTKLGFQLGYLDGEGRPSDRAVADLLRAPLGRWGLSPKRVVLKYARAQMRAVGVEDLSRVPHVLQRLVEIGDCDELYIGHEPYLAPAMPRRLSVGGGVYAYLGVSDLPEGVSAVDRGHPDIVRRIRIDTDEAETTLELSGVKDISLANWLTPPGYIRHASRRLHHFVNSDAVSLGGFWDILEGALTEEGLKLGPDAEVRILGGTPGGFFGRHDSPEPVGRWTTDPGEGVWCAYRRGYGDTHWHPCIISITDEIWRALDLYNTDEWRWAVLARGRRIKDEEVVHSDKSSVQLTFPPPGQLRAAMDILGSPSGPWTWDVSPDSPDLWSLLN